MTGDTKKIIEQLRQKLINYQKELKTLGKQFLKAKNGNKQDIAKLRDKVKELEQSELTNGEKQTKINQILTEYSEELEAVDKLLEEERTQYRSLRDQIIDKLCGPCSACVEKAQDKKHLRQKNFYLSALVGLLVVLFFVFHIWFIQWAWGRKVKCCNHSKK
ncbi:16150_t:CDS:2 [Racocetra persica]|uniref:16150_t:CDS:1 n=1 Tax=Racocetra persica TaxID=160502 RepID=A0ACA9Q0D8_9GLOM|nr:16150_t:CDS:2 [Racocetra persica]